VLILIAGCGSLDVAVGRVEAVTTLEVAGRTNAYLSLAADGDRVAAAWAASSSDGTDVYAAFSGDGGEHFAKPVRVNDVAGDASAGGEQPPRIVIRDRRVDVVWVSKHGGAAAIRAASSNDGGATFAPATTITPPGLTGARGWESAALADDGALHAVWLDGRPPSRPAAAVARDASLRKESTSPHQHGAMIQNIFHATWKENQAPVETQVAANVCFCCKTAIVTRGSDVYVAWRHLFPGGVRDIAVARSADGGATFSAPVRVSDDEWKLDACPDDGPSMAIDRAGALRITWPTLAHDPGGDRIAIFEASSADNGRTFTPRTRVSTTASASHPRLATGPVGRALVWDELANGARRVWMRAGDTAPAEQAGGGATANYPAVAATSHGFVVGWTEQDGERSIVRTRRVGPR
jgi:hypothetical protein